MPLANRSSLVIKDLSKIKGGADLLINDLISKLNELSVYFELEMADPKYSKEWQIKWSVEQIVGTYKELRQKELFVCQSIDSGYEDLPYKIKETSGYFVLLDQNHNEIVSEHRYVAAKKFGKNKIKGMIVHHVDGDKLNNSPDNLALMTRSEHSSMHGKRRAASPKQRKGSYDN